METLKFKTNIKCGSCVATVTPFLNNAEGVEKWDVNLISPERVLEVQTDRSPEEIAQLIKNAGYNAEKIV
jgi:copper chaperone